MQVPEPACDHIQEGSGFVAAPDLVVTNAHVVAGGAGPAGPVGRPGARCRPRPWCSTRPSTSPCCGWRAWRAEPLPMSSSEWGRGTAGAVLGYPEGGPLTGGAPRSGPCSMRPAATSTATRRSCGTSTSSRPSCGPATAAGRSCSTNGQVAGVVFAASTHGPDHGVRDHLAAGPRPGEPATDQLTSPVDTGPVRRLSGATPPSPRGRRPRAAGARTT